jgi:hypothetical protein
VFSCLLGTAEEETALSIIEPVSLNMEISAKRRGRHEAGKLPGILDAAPPEYADQTLEVIDFQTGFSGILSLLSAVILGDPLGKFHQDPRGSFSPFSLGSSRILSSIFRWILGDPFVKSGWAIFV